MRAYVFSDIGSLWNVDADGPEVRDVNSVRASLGVGVEFVTAFGRIRVDAAEPLLKEDFDKTELFRFSFGTRF
jgi:outer membrane protein insertion porin family